MRAIRLRPLLGVKGGGCRECILIWSNDGVGPGALGEPWGGVWGVGGVGGGWLDPWSLLALLIPIGSILYILYMDCLWTAPTHPTPHNPVPMRALGSHNNLFTKKGIVPI